MKKTYKLSSSFRDPSGFVYVKNKEVYRQINRVYKDDYELFISSGLYDSLRENNLIVFHEEVSPPYTRDAYKIIKPEHVPFISYPYEWSFDQLKDAAIATLDIHLHALKHGMILKDASAYNIQFVGSKPKLIDTLSFTKYIEGTAWYGYRQFCQHFLAPLLLMKHFDMRANLLSRIFIDGIPLDYTSRILPWKTYLNGLCLLHIHLHSRSQKVFASYTLESKKAVVTKKVLENMAASLRNNIQSLSVPNKKTEWGNYYTNTNYSKKSLKQKEAIVSSMVKSVKPQTVWDLGANDGRFSEFATKGGAYVVSLDIDPVAVNQSYLRAKQNNQKLFLPLVMDLSNPSPSLGWANNERDSLLNRGKADLVLALALIHHLAIGNNVPFESIAEFCSQICQDLIIEYVDKNDSKVQGMLSSREDIFSDYTMDGFEQGFGKYFDIREKKTVPDTKRTIYLMHKKRSLQH